MIRWFSEIGRSDIADVGGKGANLGEMTRAKFPVPPGFCITIAGYRRHIESSKLWPSMALILKSIEYDQIEQVERASSQLRKLIIDAPVPQEVQDRVLECYRTLCSNGFTNVAVRSSATAEDLPDASFAGQQETFLSVKGADKIIMYVRECWASLWTTRSISYRYANGYKHEDVYLSVIIQAMIESDKSGVLFTTNPLNGNVSEMLAWRVCGFWQGYSRHLLFAEERKTTGQHDIGNKRIAFEN